MTTTVTIVTGGHKVIVEKVDASGECTHQTIDEGSQATIYIHKDLSIGKISEVHEAKDDDPIAA